MDTLTYVERGKDKLYCFIEVCQQLFPQTPKSTVRNWCRSLKIPTVTCEPAERSRFKTNNAGLGGTFGLISQDEVERLMEFRASKRARLTVATTESCSSAETITTAELSTDQVSKTINSTIAGEREMSRDIVVYSDSSESENETLRVKSPVMPSTPEVQCTPETKPVTARKRYRLPIEECSEELKTELKDLRKFYERPLNPLRSAAPFATATLEKLRERTLCFLHYCKNVKNITELRLSVFSNSTLYTDYLEHLRDTRKLKPSTLVAHITVAINVVKFNIAVSNSSLNPSFSSVIQAYQSFQRQFQRESSVLAKRSKEGLTSKSTKQFYFAHVLETLRSLRDKYFESAGLIKNRHLHDFVLLATFVRGIPGRSKELRTMRLFCESEKNMAFDYTTVESGNFIVFHEGERVVILQFDFKTAKTAGPTKIDLSDDRDLVYYLKLYLRIRSSLLGGKDHDFFFCNRHGGPFDSSGSFAKYLGDIFEREISIRASTTALRHSIITYFNSLDDAKDSSIRKSLALLMKHSVRYQESVYNDQSNDEKVRPARLMIRNKIAKDVFGNVSDVEGENSNTSAGENSDDSDDFELKPRPGDIVALLDPVSSEENVEFFLAKVARYSESRNEVHLIHLERLKDDEQFYRLKPGCAWTESAKSLIFPIDCVWNQTNKAYELRTLAKDIFHAVYGKN